MADDSGALTARAGHAGDRIFKGMAVGAGLLVLAIMASIAAFLVWKALPSFSHNSASFLTERQWFPDQTPPKFGIAALLYGTVVAAVIAMVLAVPTGIGTALFITFYAPRRLAGAVAYVVDLLAAVPSIIFGLWGLQVLMPHTLGLAAWLDRYLGFIPFFHNTQGIYSKSLLIAGIVLAIMILPTVSAISREVFRQVPGSHTEAALALGATRWEMVRTAVLPFGRSGIVSAAMLGLGRALGETIAVALILSAVFDVNIHISEPGGNTFAANIALKWNEADANGLSALVASGLVLFIITLGVNSAARAIVNRGTQAGA